MEAVKHSAVTPSKSRLARTFAKVFHIKAVTEVAPDDGPHKTKSHENSKKDQFDHTYIPTFEDEDEELQDKAVKEAFVSKLFAAISAVKATYAEMQFAQCPYDPDGIQSADQTIVSELKHLSELKQSYLKEQLNETSPHATVFSSEIQELNNTLKIYEITCTKLDSQIKLKESEIVFLKEKLAEVDSDNRSLEREVYSSGEFASIRLSDITIGHFISYYQQTLKSIRSFVRLLIEEMESANWDLDVAANSIEPGTSFSNPNHKCFVFESFVCKQMFDNFSYPDFSPQNSTPNKDKWRRLFFDCFTELEPVRPADYLARKPKSKFAKFFRKKYSRLVHPKMEVSIFGNLDQRDLVNSGGVPATAFSSAFSEMAKSVWVLHCLALCFDQEVSVFQVSKGSRFSEVYMESLNRGGFSETEPRVAFPVVPGFRIGKSVIQCQVYLR